MSKSATEEPGVLAPGRSLAQDLRNVGLIQVMFWEVFDVHVTPRNAHATSLPSQKLRKFQGVTESMMKGYERSQQVTCV